MKKIILFLAAVAFLCACHERNTPSYYPNGSSGNSNEETPKETSANFEYYFTSYNVLRIKDKSVGKEVIYDYGDGKSDTISLPYEYLLLHIYEKEGTYTITATVTGKDGVIKTHSEKVVIRKPDTYITGVKYISVDVPGEYYKAKLVDDDFFTTTWFNTSYTSIPLSPTSLPFTYYFTNPVKMDGLKDDEYYTLYIYHNSKNSGNGTQCLKQEILSAVLDIELPFIERSNNSGNTVVRILLEYK